MREYKEIPFLILAGGLGTRLASAVSDVPKALAQVGGMPFLEWQLRWLESQGMSNIYLLVGYKAEKIFNFIKLRPKTSLKISLIKEDRQLGTGGAVLNFFKKTRYAGPFFSMNGDTLIGLSLREVMDIGFDENLIQMVASEKPYSEKFYGVIFDKDEVVTGLESSHRENYSGWVNSGLIFFPHELSFEKELNEDLKKSLSLEKDILLSKSINALRIKIFKSKVDFIDMGVPEDFYRLNNELIFWKNQLKI